MSYSMSLFAARKLTGCTGSDVLQTFGETIAELIERIGDRAILWDTKKLGRPNTMELLAEQYHNWNAEGARNGASYVLRGLMWISKL
jgi:hypothetical protein